MALSRRLRQGIGLFWRPIQAAVRKGQSVFGTVSRTAEIFAAENIPTSMIDTSVIDQLAGFAHGTTAAQEAIATADPSAMIDSSMISREPFSMDLNQYNTSPRYHVYLGMWVEGEAEPVYRTITDITDINMTVQDFANLMRIEAERLQVGTVPGGGIGGAVRGIASIGLHIAPARVG